MNPIRWMSLGTILVVFSFSTVIATAQVPDWENPEMIGLNKELNISIKRIKGKSGHQQLLLSRCYFLLKSTVWTQKDWLWMYWK